MKFYIAGSWLKIRAYNLTAIYNDHFNVIFYKNGKTHNTKNVAYIRRDGYKTFCLNDKYFGDQNYFTKKSWRKFVKLQAFL
jgi:hypothetical protein